LDTPGSTSLGLANSQEPNERTSLINSSTRNEISESSTYQSLQSVSQPKSGPVDEEAIIYASESNEVVAVPKHAAGIAGVISVLLLGMCVYRDSAV
jgi:hypothetical protein